MHEPSVVMTRMSPSSPTKYSPGITFTTLRKCGPTQKKNEASPGLRRLIRRRLRGAAMWHRRSILKPGSFVDRLAAQAEEVARTRRSARSGRRTAGPGPHRGVHALEHPALRRRIEIDHHVAAEHDVERRAPSDQRSSIRLCTRNLDQALQFGLDADEPGVGSGCAGTSRRWRQTARLGGRCRARWT